MHAFRGGKQLYKITPQECAEKSANTFGAFHYRVVGLECSKPRISRGAVKSYAQIWLQTLAERGQPAALLRTLTDEIVVYDDHPEIHLWAGVVLDQEFKK